MLDKPLFCDRGSPLEAWTWHRMIAFEDQRQPGNETFSTDAEGEIYLSS